MTFKAARTVASCAQSSLILHLCSWSFSLIRPFCHFTYLGCLWLSILTLIPPAECKTAEDYLVELQLFGYFDNYGNLRLRFSSMKQLPAQLKVDGFMDIEASQIQALPEGLEVKGYLNAAYTSFTKIPMIFVEGDINLSHSKVRQLPPNFTVNGNLYLINTPIERFPPRLQVKGNLYIAGTKLATLPNDLSVSGNIYSGKLKLDNVPDKFFRQDEVKKERK